jgi:hypothetical protein
MTDDFDGAEQVVPLNYPLPTYDANTGCEDNLLNDPCSPEPGLAKKPWISFQIGSTAKGWALRPRTLERLVGIQAKQRLPLPPEYLLVPLLRLYAQGPCEVSQSNFGVRRHIHSAVPWR